MGKIRVKSFDEAEQEAKDKKLSAKRQAKKDEKNAAKAAEASVDGQAIESPEQTAPQSEIKPEEEKKEKKSSKKFTDKKKNFRSKAYMEKKLLINKNEQYPLSEALKLLNEAHLGKFDESVELHINTNSAGISGNMNLPHGTGKVTRVAIADDTIIAEVEKEKINFDILLAHPSMMPKLAKVAKVLGPRGLMPNPKNGTISQEPEKVAEKYKGGQMNFKTEAKAPIIHLMVGKLSFGPDKLSENITTAVGAVRKSNIRDITLKSTMSPGIKIRV